MEKYYLIMDLGGTKSTGALFTESGLPVDDYAYVVQSKTYQGEDAVYNNTRKVLDEVIGHFGVSMDQILGIGVGAPGPLNQETGVIIDAPMMGWHNFPLAKKLSEDYGKPVRIDNDGNLGALAEYKVGEGKGFHTVMYMTVSTGCGGGIVINDELYRGYNGSAAEFGHISLDVNGLKCPCGAVGCVEMYASGTAINRRAVNDLKAGMKNHTFELADYDESKLDGKVLFESASMGDEYAIEAYKKEGFYLGCALAAYFNLYDPEVIVLGGGVTKARKFFHDTMVEVWKERCIQPVDESQIRYSKINDRIVLYGAYHMIHDYVNKLSK